MTKKVWEGIFALVAVVIVINVAIASLRPYLPLLGLSLAILIFLGIIFAVVRVFWMKKKLW